ncbi:MAG: adenine phosphoribosyltransferase [Candidatus Nitrosocaldaceae archaeon]|nr:MAG: adenine phosphoribosyltransferase [Candidatus Nitrosocaldaceae archaeon]
MNLKALIREYPDFPKPGVLFRDISPILRDPQAFKYVIDKFYEEYKDDNIDLIAGIESRGFIFASALALRFNKGMIMVRKQGKLPGDTTTKKYDIEYGNATMEVQRDIIKKGERVLITDDLIATGGTAKAAAQLVEELGGEVAGFAFVIELSDLKGVNGINSYKIYSLVRY